MYLSTQNEATAYSDILNYYYNKLKLGVAMSFEGHPHLKSGVGKSYTAIKTGEIVDSDFSEGTKGLDKIAWTPEDFRKAMDIVEEDGRPGQVVVVDEAGILVNRKKWFSFINNAIADTVMTMRTLRGIAIFVTPSIWRIEKDIRTYVTLLGQCDKEFGTSDKTHVNVKLFRCYWDDHKNKLFRYYPKLYVKDKGRVCQFTRFYPTLPKNQELLDAYEKKARKYKKEVRKVIQKMETQDLDVEDFVDKVIEDGKLIKTTNKGQKKVYGNDIRYEYDTTADMARTVARKVNERLESGKNG